jgi:hypothetical protein
MKTARAAFTIASWFFVAGVAIQVFLAGLVVVARRMNWEGHIVLGHSLGLPLLIMLVAMYLGKLSAGTKRLTWLLFAVYVLQADVLIFLRQRAPFLSALHPVLALFDFGMGWALARAALQYLRAVEDPSEDLSPAVKTAGD